MLEKCIFTLIFLGTFAFCYGNKIKVKNFSDRIKFNDCNDVLRSGEKESGIYPVYLNGSEPFEVYCHFESGASTYSIMQQKYGGVSFARSWYDYENGFGAPASGDFWIGLKHMKSLTDAGFNILTVTLQDWNKNFSIKTIQYKYFALGSANQRYPLHIGGYVSSHVLPDDFSHNNGMPFATIDLPDFHHCAINQKGGWWYNYCSYTLPTGHYYYGGPYTPSGGFYDGIYYNDWHGYGYSLRYIRMDLSNI